MSERPQVMTGLDDLMVHQTIASVEQPQSTDRNWSEKGYLVAYDTSGEVMVAVGVGKYSNRNVFDGFAGVAVPGYQYNVRASRELRPDIDSTSVGPIHWESVNPPRGNRIRLDENDVGIAFDIEFESPYPPVAETGGQTRIRGVTLNDTIRFFQLGRARGWVTVEGQRFELSPERSFAYKDRSWGVRGMTGAPASWIVRNTEMDVTREAGMYLGDREPRSNMSGMFCVDRDTESLCVTFAESADGTMLATSGAAGAGGFLVTPQARGKAAAPQAVTEMDIDWKFHEGTRRARRLDATVTLEDGTKRELAAEGIGLTYYFRGGGYFGFRNWYQGKHFGKDLVVDGEKLDLSDKAVLDELYGCEEIAARYTVDGVESYGVLEPFAIGELPKYGITADHLG